MSGATHQTSPQSCDFLNLRRLPARLTVSQAAVLLGFADHDIPLLVRAKLLTPLGNPKPNAPKYYCAAELERRSQDYKWLDKATAAIARHWRNRKRSVPQALSEAPTEPI